MIGTAGCASSPKSLTAAVTSQSAAPSHSSRPAQAAVPNRSAAPGVGGNRVERVIVAGDSIPEDLGPMVAATLNGHGFDVHTESHPSTGLVRDDFYDWTAAARRIAAEHPDAVILLMGGNDVQPVKLPGGQYAAPASPQWEAEYSRRAGLVLDALQGGGTTRVYWLTMPTTDRAGMNPAITDMGQALRTAAKGRKNVTVYDTDVLLGANAGTAAAHQPDGIHFSILGSQMVSNALIGRLRLAAGLPS